MLAGQVETAVVGVGVDRRFARRDYVPMSSARIHDRHRLRAVVATGNGPTGEGVTTQDDAAVVVAVVVACGRGSGTATGRRRRTRDDGSGKGGLFFLLRFFFFYKSSSSSSPSQSLSSS